MKESLNYLFFVLAVLLLGACGTAEGDFPGREYMPDMGHSVAVEANVYTIYGLNTWEDGSVVELKELSGPRKQIKGTIPRGYQSQSSDNGVHIYPNGFVPYTYENTEEERTRATLELLENPFPITAAGLERAKTLYNIQCGICHGDKGDGNGYLVRDDGGVYPAQPASFITEEFLSASNGRYYHAIMHGKNVMGSYKDKLSYKERWEVIHYIRSLQAKELGKVYNEELNTLGDFGIPQSEWSNAN